MELGVLGFPAGALSLCGQDQISLEAGGREGRKRARRGGRGRQLPFPQGMLVPIFKFI